MFRHVCRIGLEGIVSKRTDPRYRNGPSRMWLKPKNPESEAVRRERGGVILVLSPNHHAQMDYRTLAIRTTLMVGPWSRRSFAEKQLAGEP
jgi:hypothetical protein